MPVRFYRLMPAFYTLIVVGMACMCVRIAVPALRDLAMLSAWLCFTVAIAIVALIVFRFMRDRDDAEVE